MNASQTLINHIKRMESCALTAYQDTVGVWTIGYGHTKGVKDVFGVQFSGWSQVATVIKREVVGTITFTIETIGRAKEALQGFINWTKSLVGGVTGSVSGAVKEEARQQRQKWLNDKKVVQGGTTYTVVETVPSSATTPTPTKKAGGGSRSARSTTTAKVEEVFPEGSMKALQKEMRELQDAQQRVTTPEAWQDYGKKIDEVTEKMNTLKGVVKETKVQEMAQGLSGVTENSLKANQSYWQGNLASQLTDSAVQGFGGQPYVEGEKIFLGMNNSSRRMGRGEIVTTQTLRRMGLTR